jgi:uncharacterized protein YecE (DUF72 family)
MAVIHIGTQGWSYPDWVGSFYPPGAKQEDWLPFYVRVFDTVELDTTFYHPPRPSVVRSWARHSPEGFRFTAKVPQRITHEARLAQMGGHLAEFADSLGALGDKLGPLLVQLPAEFERDAGTLGVLDRFLAAAPRDVRFAVEFRHGSWHAPATYELLRRHRAALAWTSWRTLPRVAEVTTDFLYLRWLGDRADIARFDRVTVDRTGEFAAWQADLERALPEVREVYGYFNNHWAGHSPASANEMKRRLGLVVEEPKQQWPQGELW